ncbi:MAG: ATP-dependent RNA helicase [Sphaerochaetaceae bacterium]
MLTLSHLPVYQNRQQILDALKDNQVIVVESPTGSGKTTQMPIILHEAGYAKEKMIGITQPRRVATLSVTDFIAKQLDDKDSLVAYKMRFSDTTKANTKIKIMTDGILLMELKADPLLSRYSVILVDEAHERSLNIDFILGLLKNVLNERKEFKVIVSSATINTKIFSSFFDNAPIISIDAIVHPIEIIYKPLAQNNESEEIYSFILDIVKQESKKPGDILIFLTGEFEIKRCINTLYESSVAKDLLILPLYGRLSEEEQEQVFIPTPKGKTKVVVATNIAETSITIDGITTVIDSGNAKINYYNQRNFTSSLVTVAISQSSALQRSGRAGRTQSGKCYRLYTKEDYENRPKFGTEEILRTDLSEVVLRMSELAIYNWEKFSFITRPKDGAIASGEETLKFINAIDNERRLTSIGQLMVQFPLLPRHSRVIVEAMNRYPQVIDEVIIAISYLSTKTPFILPPNEEDSARKAHQTFNSEDGDFISYLEIYRKMVSLKGTKAKQNWCKAFYLDYESMVEIVHVTQQLSEIVSQMGFPLSGGGSTKDYLCCLASGLQQYVCIKAERNVYRSLTTDQIYLHPGSAWFSQLPQFILAGEIVQTSRMYARSVSPLKKQWLDEIDKNLRVSLQSLLKGKKGRVVKEQIEVKDHNFITLYKKSYPLINSPKGKKKIALIPLEDLKDIAKNYYYNQRKPKNIAVALTYRNFYIHFQDKLSSVVELHNKIDLDKGILESPPSGNFFSSDPALLIDNLYWILAFSKMKKRKRHLGFVELNYHNKGLYRYAINSSAFGALDNSLFSVGQLIDELDSKKYPSEAKSAKKRYEQLLKIFDS